MEKEVNYFLDYPPELEVKIADDLNTKDLINFAISNKQIFTNLLEIIKKRCSTLIAGYNNTYFYQNNKLFVCGSNDFGQLGLGSAVSCNEFKPSLFKGKIKQLRSGISHTLIVTEENELWACGLNKYGQLGIESENKDEPIFNKFTKVNFTGGEIKQVLVGNSHTFIITTDNQLWACGRNTSGQLGLEFCNDQLSFTHVALPGKLRQVIVGTLHTFIVIDNELWACGSNQYGQLGLGSNEDHFTLTKIKIEKLPKKIRHFLSIPHQFDNDNNVPKNLCMAFRKRKIDEVELEIGSETEPISKKIKLIPLN